MDQTTKSIIAAIGVALFGLFLIWQGVTDNVYKNSEGQRVFPRWAYIIGGAFMLVLPLTFAVLMLFA